MPSPLYIRFIYYDSIIKKQGECKVQETELPSEEACIYIVGGPSSTILMHKFSGQGQPKDTRGSPELEVTGSLFSLNCAYRAGTLLC